MFFYTKYKKEHIRRLFTSAESVSGLKNTKAFIHYSIRPKIGPEESDITKTPNT
jgi:hypothetical protein